MTLETPCTQAAFGELVGISQQAVSDLVSREVIQPGRTVQVYYTTTPNTLDNPTDDFADVTGLPASSVEVVILGACYKLLSYVDAGRINLSSAEADLNDTKIPSTAGVASSRYIYALYQQRLNDEALKLQDKYPIRIHYTK